MKIIRPLKYVIAAAAVCILCFPGNEQYIFTVLAASTENDVVVLPEQSGEHSGKCIRNNDINKTRLKSIKLSCIILSNKLHNTDYLHLLQPVSGNYNKKTANTDNLIIHDQFTGKLPGNRSP